MIGVLIRERWRENCDRREEDTDTQRRKPCEGEDRLRLKGCGHKTRKPRSADSHRKLEETRRILL